MPLFNPVLASSPSTTVSFFEDFLGYQSGNVNSGFNGTASGTNAQYVPAGGGPLIDVGHPGIAPLSTGTTTTGAAGIWNGTNIVASGGAITLEWLMNLSALSDGTNTYTLLMGLCDIFSNATDVTTNGVYMQYTHGTNSGNLVLKAKNGGSTTTTNSTTAMATGWHKFQIVINAAGTLATYYLDGVSMGIVSGGIPVLITTPMNVAFSIVKSLGTTAAKMNIDYVFFSQSLTTAR